MAIIQCVVDVENQCQFRKKKSKKYVEGISCPKCQDYLTNSQKKRFAMRQKQILMAKKIGKRYIFQKEFCWGNNWNKI